MDTNPAAEASARQNGEEVATFEPAPVLREEHSEDPLTRVIEQQTAKIPSHWFLAAALVSMAGSLGLELAGETRWSRFVGMWSPSLLVMGVYNKLVKLSGPR